MSQDIQVEILQYLNPKDLFMFGVSSKRALSIAHRAWKCKFIKEFGDLNLPEVEEDGIIYIHMEGKKTWYTAFILVSSKSFTYHLDEQITRLQGCFNERGRRRFFRSMMDLVVGNLWLVQTKKYTSFLRTVEIKLLSMKNQCDIEEYYKTIFPSTYLDHFSLELNKLFE